MTFTLKTPQAAIFPKHRRAAVHWRQPFLLPGAKKASFEIACGYAIDEHGLSTDDPALVTCESCRGQLPKREQHQ